ncbi:hypothetical protein AJ80_05177 [Polytolypa hystricis UAMH7299]|uniref:Uncharacterized protein n=1 Tax=Polytolypa hystricis (strain UAMH7299) TaxID=1447883 RepID=A0A2B7Y6I4_POLH7|nr:hypothetical protein AJ80_05177 [Polytolypa hystricis UAMH7299]
MSDRRTSSDLGPVLEEIRETLRAQNAALQKLVDVLARPKEQSCSAANPQPEDNNVSGDAREVSCNSIPSSDADDGTAENSAPHSDDKNPLSVYRGRLAYYIKGPVDFDEMGVSDLDPSFASTIKARGLQPQQLVAHGDWKYYGEGLHPDYIPDWELIVHDDKYYHIDDRERSHPISLSDNFPPKDASVHNVPYCFTQETSVPWKGVRFASTGITVDWSRLQQCLGTLYSVPPDGRIPLAFERNQLRLKCARPRDIDTYLRRVDTLLRTLHENDGRFLVQDFDSFFGLVIYDWLRGRHQRMHNLPPYWMAVQPALLAEYNQLVIQPGPCSFSILPSVLKDQVNNADSGWSFRNNLDQSNTSPRSGIRDGSHAISDQGRRFEVHGGKTSWSLLVDSDLTRPELESHWQDVVAKAFDLHLSCGRYLPSENPFQKGWTPLHINWFRILRKGEQENLVSSSWKSGPLYGSTSDQYIQETAFTLLFLPKYGSGSYRPDQQEPEIVELQQTNYITILLLAPSAMFHDNEPTCAAKLLGLICDALWLAAEAWEKLRAHHGALLDSQANEQNPLLDPDKHDALLFDDDIFSRSRLYFWAVDILEVFQQHISDTLRTWEDFWEAREQLLRAHHYLIKPYEIQRPSRIDFLHGKIEARISRLKEYRERFKALHTRAQALREGLFTASGVVESRAATPLGENVKLLTYVSIFYLPLGFSAAIFSINENYSTAAFAVTSAVVAVTSAVVAIVTYALIANLENVVALTKTSYGHAKRPIIRRMANDGEHKWAARATGFTAFRPHAENIRPSEWNIVVYLVLQTLRQLRAIGTLPKWLRGRRQKEAAPGTGDPVDGERQDA